MRAGAQQWASVERLLDDIPGFAGSRIDSQLSDGPTNASYLLVRADSQYVLRLDKPDAKKLGLDRGNEMRICRAVADAGLAPEPLYFDAASGVYLRRFLPGRNWLVSDLAVPGKLERLARLLRKLHRLPPLGAAFDPFASARRYAAQSGGERSRSLQRRSEHLMGEMKANPAGRVLCHNDLVCHNVVQGERLFLIDWEYAGVGDPFFDLAVVVRHHELDQAAARVFLDAYLGRPASGGEIRHLDLQCGFYACLLELWERIYPGKP